MAGSYKIGTTIGTMVTLESLGVRDPKGRYRQGTEQHNLVSGGVRNVGLVRVVWTWAFLSPEEYTALRVFMPNASDRLFIESRTTEDQDEFRVFEVRSAWPIDPDIDTFKRISFEIKFAVMGTGAVTVFLQALSINSTFIPAALQNIVAIHLEALTLSSNIPSLDAQPGPVSIQLDALVLDSSIPSLGVGYPQTINLDSLTLTGTTPNSDVLTGGVLINLDSLSFAGSIPSLDVQAIVSIALDALSLVSSIPVIDAQPGGIQIALDNLSLTGSIPVVDVQPGGVTITLDSLSLSSSSPSLSVT